PKAYHSSSVLLPDGRVLATGGTNNFNGQVYSPDYIAQGLPQPTISSAPSAANYGDVIPVQSPDADNIGRVTMVRLGSSTHAFNMDQRFNELTFSENANGGLDVNLPSNPNLAPPGYYFLFVINRQGVPSKSSLIQITQLPSLGHSFQLTVTPSAV